VNTDGYGKVYPKGEALREERVFIHLMLSKEVEIQNKLASNTNK
jgi:hypothetical protein